MDELFYIMLIIYSLVFISFVSFHFYSYLRFKMLVKKNDVVSMLDRSYELAIYTVGFLYLAIYISSIVDVFLDRSRYENGKLPFIIGAMPLMAITFKMLVNQGLYAYNSIKLFIGKKSCFDKGNVKIAGIHKNSYTNRVKLIL